VSGVDPGILKGGRGAKLFRLILFSVLGIEQLKLPALKNMPPSRFLIWYC